MSKEHNKPELTLSDGNIKAHLWKREGPNGHFYSTGFSKTYQDNDGHYQSSHHFAGTDLLKLSELAKQAYQHSREMQLLDRQAVKGEAVRLQPDRERE